MNTNENKKETATTNQTQNSGNSVKRHRAPYHAGFVPSTHSAIRNRSFAGQNKRTTGSTISSQTTSTHKSHQPPVNPGSKFPGPRKSGGRSSGRRPILRKSMIKGPIIRRADTKRPEDKVIVPSPGDNIRIIPLGGVEEIGKNMTIVEYKDDIVIIDAGFQFAPEEMPGIDYLIPNIKYLEERKDKIRGIVVTHGHLDHIGGIPYIIDKLGNPPIYTREFGALLIKKRQAEFPHLPELNLKIAEKNDASLPISKHFKVKFFGLTHSIPDSAGVIIETPFGDIISTGDVRVENDEGKPGEKEFEQYDLFKKRNVLLLMMDSTGIDKPGWTISEEKVLDNIDKIVSNVPGRILIATFSSQVERIIAFIRIAKKYGKKVAIEGRSMKNNVEIIKQLGFTEIKHVIPVEEIEKYPAHKIMILATGAQGEEFAALMRMANKNHKYVQLNKTDTIILSSSVIPGNEVAVSKLKDNLYRHDSKIITYLDSDVHASGHGKRGELEWIHRQIPYKFFMPVHGHHFMLKMHAELAKDIGIKPENIIVPDNGSLVEIYDNGQKIKKLKEKVVDGDMVVEGFSIGDVQDVVIRDRQTLASEGMFIIFAMVNSRTGKLKKSPDIISRGFVYLRESQELLKDVRNIIKKTIEDACSGMNPINFDYAKEKVTDDVSRYLLQKTNKRPVVIPVILGV